MECLMSIKKKLKTRGLDRSLDQREKRGDLSIAVKFEFFNRYKAH